MTPAEILKEMRDIHLPASLQDALPPRFAAEPFYALAAVLIVLGLIWWRRRTTWRREAAAELNAALAEAEPARRWARLTGLVRHVGRYRRARPPDCLFLPPERVGPAEIERLAGHIRTLIGGAGGPGARA